ncbi:uncharacterized protein LOC121960143 [Plectropomus leopardus]|uniref:uncharacterized protein LOC121960143 n=1 Tax=Plectropomus leopardus TaxID=160734 RepID=UPI001C4B7FCA|nr:uncharacterized protein LOC121960143 [Plectropomus leopardus]
MFGGYDAGGNFCKDLHVLSTESLVWQKWEVKGESPAACSGQTLTAHHDKDIYLFGGKSTNEDDTVTSSNEIHKLSISKMKWKVPLYVGIPPARRHGHTAFILRSHVIDEGDSVGVWSAGRQPQLHSHKIPNVRYELSESAAFSPSRSAAAAQVFVHRDFSAVRDQAMKMIQTAFTLLDQEFHKLDQEKSELSQGVAALQREKEAHEACRQQQQQELQEMLDRHRSQNEACSEREPRRTTVRGGSSADSERRCCRSRRG